MSRFIAERFAVYLCNLDPTVGVEMRKTRPCVVLSPEEMHQNVLTVIIAPMTTTQTRFPTRVRCHFSGKSAEIALDQLRALDIQRFGRRVGAIDAATQAALRKKIEDLLLH